MKTEMSMSGGDEANRRMQNLKDAAELINRAFPRVTIMPGDESAMVMLTSQMEAAVDASVGNLISDPAVADFVAKSKAKWAEALRKEAGLDQS